VDDATLKGLIRSRALSPADIVAARQRRRRPDSLLGPHSKLMIIAGDHPPAVARSPTSPSVL
jgi:hypothetical protein